MAKTTAIRAPTDDPQNHTVVLRQLKEASETGQRLRGDPNDSYVRVGELVGAGVARFVNGGIVAPSPASLPPTTVPSTRKVNTAGSLTGGGALASDLTLELVNDSASPGNSMLYGTNASGVKGWYTQPSGGGSGTVSVADSITGTGASGSPLTLVNDNSSPGNSMLYGTNSSGMKGWYSQPSGGGGGAQTPGTIPDLQFWFDASQITASTAGVRLAFLQNFNSTFSFMSAYLITGTGAKTTATQLNGKSVVNFTNSGEYTFTGNSTASGIDFSQGATFFVVYNQTALQYQEFLCGGSGSLAFRLTNAGNLALLNPTIAQFATATTATAASTWFQANCTYLPSSGAYAFRLARAANGSGTAVQTIDAFTFGLGWDPGAGGTTLNGMLAEMITYSRVLTSTEISAVENYLNAKWGV